MCDVYSHYLLKDFQIFFSLMLSIELKKKKLSLQTKQITLFNANEDKLGIDKSKKLFNCM